MRIKSYGLSLLLSVAGFLLCLISYNLLTETPIGCIIWTAGAMTVALIAGLIGLEISYLIQRKSFIVIRRNIFISLAIALVASTLIGAVGQALFALDTEEYTDIYREEEELENTGVVFMMDNSGSMAYVYDDCIEASCGLIDELDESCYYQYLNFSDFVCEKSELLQLTDANKTAMKNFVRNTLVSGAGTFFAPPINAAYDTLTSSEADGLRKVAILFSDCVASDSFEVIPDELIDKITSSDIDFYTIMISEDINHTLPEDDPIAEISKEVYTITYNDDGTINIDKFADLLISAASGTVEREVTKTRIIFGDEMMLFSNDESIPELIIRIVTYILYSVMICFVYYGFGNIGRLLLNIVPGLFAGLVSIVHPILGIVFLMLFSLAAIINPKIEADQMEDVNL